MSDISLLSARFGVNSRSLSARNPGKTSREGGFPVIGVIFPFSEGYSRFSHMFGRIRA